MTSALTHKKILVVEDDYFLALDMARDLRASGAEVLGPVPTGDAGLEIASQDDLDGAVLDIHLRGGSVYPLADLLMTKGVPFLFSTGYETSSIPKRYEGIQVLGKPMPSSDVCEHLAGTLPLPDVGNALSYSVTQEGDFWCWEVKRGEEVVERGRAASHVNARRAAMNLALRRFE